MMRSKIYPILLILCMTVFTLSACSAIGLGVNYEATDNALNEFEEELEDFEDELKDIEDSLEMTQESLSYVSPGSTLDAILSMTQAAATQMAEEDEPFADDVAEEPVEEPVQEEVQVPVTLTIWHNAYPGTAYEEALALIVELARGEFPNYTIELVQVPYDGFIDRYTTSVAAGIGPDLFLFHNEYLGDWVRDGLVLDLSRYEGWLSNDFFPIAIESMRVDDSLYGVPFSASTVALYYNKSLVDFPPTTTAELLAAVESGQVLASLQDAYFLYGFFGAFGGELLDADGYCIADQWGFVEAMEYLVDLQDAGAIFDIDYGLVEDMFSSGEVAMLINGPWALDYYKSDLGDDLGVIKLPAGPGGGAGNLVGVEGFFVNPNTMFPDEAVDLALFLTNAESSQVFASLAEFNIPIRSDVYPSDELMAAFAAAAASGAPNSQLAEFANFWDPFRAMFDDVLTNGENPDDAVSAACAAMNAERDK